MKKTRNISFALLAIIMLIIAGCFSERKQDEKDSESVGETTNQAVNPLMDGDAGVEESPLAFDENTDDPTFIARVAASNYSEIELARLAAQKSESSKIKDIARMFKNNHSEALVKLKDVANTLQVNSPAAPDDTGRKKVEELRKINDEEKFNKEWLREMINMHEKSVATLEGYRAEDERLKTWVGETLPTVKMHLDVLKKLD